MSFRTAKSAYSVQEAAPAWLGTIPLMDSRYASLVTAGEMPRDNPQYSRKNRLDRLEAGNWENAWAYLLGAARRVHSLCCRAKGKGVPIPRSWRSAMHSRSCHFRGYAAPLGAVYYAPSHT